MNTLRRSVLPLFCSLALFQSACSSASSTTTGKRITLKTKIVAPDATAPFATAMGWNVSISKLVVSTGAFYYFDGATIFSQATPRESAPTRAVERLLGIKTAWAHPGHYIPGEARGQMLTATTVDLRAGSVDLAVGDGVTGIVRSATFSFGSPATGPLASEVGAHVVVIEGTATKGSDTRIFRAELAATDLLDTQGKPAVEGCTFTETTLEGDGTVTATVKLPLWFDQVEFDTIAASTDSKPALMKADDLGRKELVRGMKAADGYVFSYTP